MILSGANRTRLAVLGGAALLAGYAWLLFGHVATAVGGPDSSADFNSARLMVAGTAAEAVPLFQRLDLDASEGGLLMPLGFVPGPKPGTAVPVSPPGFPLHVAAVALLSGWTTAPFFISPVAALLCLELVYLIARELQLSRLGSVAAAVLVALCPFFVFQALQPMSDVVGMLWCLAALAAALRTRRGSGAWAAAAGFAVGVAVLVRPANLVVVLPAVLLSLKWRRWNPVRFLAGALPPVLVLAFYDTAVYGVWHRTGYEIGGLQGSFSGGAFAVRLGYYAGALARTITPLLLVGALAAWADRRIALRDRALLFVWWAADLVFYAFYDPYGSWWSLRNLLPAVPALAIAAVVSWRDFVAHPLRAAKRPVLVGALSVAAFAVVVSVEWRSLARERVLRIGSEQNVYATAVRWAQRYVPDSGLVLSVEMSGALKYYADRTPVRWDWLPAGRFASLRARAENEGYAWYALLMPREVEPAQKAAPGNWRMLARVPGSDVALWRLDR